MFLRKATVKKKNNIFGGVGGVAPPPIYADLKLWFPPSTLTNPSSNNFEWLDVVSGTIKVTGNYGTGAGISSLLNGYNGLFTTGGTSAISTPVLDFPAFTFFGIVERNIPNSNNVLHFLTQSSGIIFLYITNHAGVVDQIALLGYYASTSRLNATITPVDMTNPVLIIYKFIFGNPLYGKIWCQNLNAVDNLGIIPQDQSDKMNINKGDSFLTASFEGALGEFMYYGKALSDAEINQVIDWYNSKYGVTFMNHI